jgi:tetratricopeptide (TPR) repeat protein
MKTDQFYVKLGKMMFNSRLSHITLCAVIALAIFTRLQSIREIEFKEDEARNCFLSADCVQRGIIPLIGDRSSVSTYNPPVFTYLLSLPFSVSPNPVFISGCIALLNVLAVCICYLFCGRFFSARAGLIAALYFAVNPWVVLYSRKIWANNAIPFFVMLFIFSLYKAVFENKPKYFIPAFIALGVFTQLHAVTFPLGIILIIACIASGKSYSPLSLIIGIVSFLLLYAPYLLFEIRHQFIDVKTVLQMSKAPAVFHAAAFTFPFKLASTAGFLKNMPAADLLQTLLLTAAGVYAALRIRDLRYCFLLLWLCLVPAFLAFSRTPIEHHYFIACFPGQFILIGIFVDALSQKRPAWTYPALGFVVILIAAQLVNTISFNRLIQREKNVAWNGYGPPYRARAQEIAQAIRDNHLSAEKIQQKITEGKDPAQQFKYDLMATKYIAEYVDFPPGNPLAYNTKANVYFKKEQYAQAAAAYSQALLLAPRFVEAYSNRGSLYALRADYRRAIADLTEAARLDPRNADIYMTRGLAERKSGAYGKAIEDFSLVMKLKPFFLPAYYQRAIAFYHAKEYDKAWTDINLLKGIGYPVDRDFLEDLQKESGRKK